MVEGVGPRFPLAVGSNSFMSHIMQVQRQPPVMPDSIINDLVTYALYCLVPLPCITNVLALATYVALAGMFLFTLFSCSLKMWQKKNKTNPDNLMD